MIEPTLRRLVSIRRFVPSEQIPRYAEAWARLHQAATALGAHAWHFASADQRDVYLEFLEFGEESDVRSDPATLAAIQELHAHFGEAYPTPRTLEEWVEVPSAARKT